VFIVDLRKVLFSETAFSVRSVTQKFVTTLGRNDKDVGNNKQQAEHKTAV